MGKTIQLDLDDKEQLVLLAKALSAEVRIEILKLLCRYDLNINEIAERLELPQSSAAAHIKVLEEAGLIITSLKPAVRGSMKVCTKQVKSFNIDLTTDLEEETEVINMPIGNFVDYYVEPTCGIVSEKGHIDEEDEPRCFYNPDRIKAKLLWFGKGYVEYRFPNKILTNRTEKRLELSMEICSEDHEYNFDFPSDITVWINGIEAGTWNCPSDFGGRRGKLNPDWWPDKNTQYGVLKTWILTEQGTYLDEEKVDSLPIKDYHLSENAYISVRIGIKADAEHIGGVNLFGDCFGDYAQNIRMKLVF
ncbi:helix-turn-helix domain-containing protein [Anaerocolumna sedimenticola]|uniref:Helix-turn-helix domain-containing protein n=1 Tax=Anaerocolumna sedimenticola TaxID=2696063 RepID=A0A6P1TL56_9FIRM|nr:ArsR family transcriptional regulator [Anaerocolumna sedimenticola]QHQ61784.1 helix-turn-helix domain-containing protein [Anaerocolumna sedimenticola]